jgi:hypothetical protein
MAHQILSSRRRQLLPVAAFLAVFALALVAPPDASAQAYYRWINKEGNLQISDRPPPHGTEYEVVSPRNHTSRRVTAEQGVVLPTTESSTGDRFETQVLKPIMSQERNPELCRRARDNLFWLENRDRVRVRNEQGELVYLTPEQTEEQRQAALQVVDEHCE